MKRFKKRASKKKKKKKSQQPLGQTLLETVDREEPETVLEEPRRISESRLWSIQEDYYGQLGTKAFEHATPFFVTNSVTTAECYADLMISFLRDYSNQLEPEEPIYIVEMGSGLGRFGFYLVKELNRKKDYFEELKFLDLRVVLTDMAELNVDFWGSHPALAPHVEAGRLDFAVFCPEEDREVHLRVSGEVLKSGDGRRNPTLTIGNYFIDSIRYDQFKVLNGKFEICEIGLNKKSNKFSNPNRVDIRDVVWKKTYREVEANAAYENREWCDIIEEYREYDGVFTFPSAGLRCLENLLALSSENLLAVFLDKGFSGPSHLLHYNDHPLTVHGGSFSVCVNFDVFRRYFLNKGGKALVTHHNHLDSLQMFCGLHLKADPSATLPGMTYNFHEKVDLHNPINSVERQHYVFKPDDPSEPLPLPSILGWVKLNRYDPKSVAMIGEMLQPRVASLRHGQKLELIQLLERSWENYYHFSGEVNLPFWQALLYTALNNFERAIYFLDKVHELHGEDPVLVFMKGCCFEDLGQPDRARESYERALELDPNMKEAKTNLAGLNRGRQAAQFQAYQS